MLRVMRLESFKFASHDSGPVHFRDMRLKERG